MTSPQRQAYCYGVCDKRFPFLWATADQPGARWHDTGEGPCHYLATTAKGAWAEVVRHEAITDAADVVDLDLSLWGVEAPFPSAVPALDFNMLTGDETSYPACQAEARRLRATGAMGLVAPSAAVISGEAEQYGVDPTGQILLGRVPTSTLVVIGAARNITGMPLAEGHPDPAILPDIRRLG